MTAMREAVLKLRDDEEAALDAWRLEQKPALGFEEAAAVALRDWLISLGYLPAPEDDE